MSYYRHPRLSDTPQYTIMPLPKATTDGALVPLPAPLETTPPSGTTPQPTGGGSPIAAVGGFLDSSVFGIPVKWLLIGAAAYFMLKR